MSGYSISKVDTRLQNAKKKLTVQPTVRRMAAVSRKQATQHISEMGLGNQIALLDPQLPQCIIILILLHSNYFATKII